jgi:hypothetical protein
LSDNGKKRQRQEQRQKQIPFGDDNQRNRSEGTIPVALTKEAEAEGTIPTALTKEAEAKAQSLLR